MPTNGAAAAPHRGPSPPDLLRAWRQRALLTQEQLAERTGLGVRTIRRLESSRLRARSESVRRLADALGLSEQERRQLTAAARGEPSLATPATTHIPRQLPADVAAFTGRAAELAELDRLLAVPAHRVDQPAGVGEHPTAMVISAVSGTPGVGKTALAVRWAQRVRDRFPDGQLYVNLRGYDPEQPVPAADALAGFLHALGVPGEDIPPELHERAARYRTELANRRLLVVVDNARDAEQVRPLLPGSPGCVTLVTSRDALAGLVAVHGARRLDLDALPPGDAVRLLHRLIGERVEREPEAAAVLAERCARLPLALRVAAELAAARPAASLAELAGELADRQQRLEVLDAGGDPRAAVSTVLSWSYQRLPEQAARLFRLLGLAPGPDIDAYAAAALAGSSLADARQRLELLARAHLVQPSLRGWGRYSLHDLLRAYAARLAAADHDQLAGRAALSRLFDYYLATAAAAMDALEPAERHRRPAIRPPASPLPPVADPAAARTWLDTERANLVAVCVHTAEHGWQGHTVRLATTLFRYLDSGSYYTDALTIHRHAAQAAGHAGDRAGEAHALLSLGGVDWRQGQLRQAADHVQQALARFRELGDRVGEARALTNLGLVAWRQGELRPAADHLRQARARYRELGDRVGEAHVLNNLGLVAWRQGELRPAADHSRQALARFRELGDRVGEADALNNLGTVYQRQGHLGLAADHQQQALALFRQLGNRSGEAEVLTNLGRVYWQQGHLGLAADHHQQALDLSRQLGDRGGEADALNGLGEVLRSTGKAEQARERHGAALAVAVEVGDRYEQARAHHGIAASYHAAGDCDQARRHWQHALALYTNLGAADVDDVRAHLTALDQSTGGRNGNGT